MSASGRIEALPNPPIFNRDLLIGPQVPATDLIAYREASAVESPTETDIFSMFNHEVNRKKERYASKSIGDYFKEIESRPDMTEATDRKATRTVREAIEARGVRKHPSGFSEYLAFSERTDKFKYIGNAHCTEAFVNILKAHETAADTTNRMIVVIGPIGSGKNSFIGAITSELESYMDTSEPPAYSIKDCPVQESPLHLLHGFPKEVLNEYSIGEQECLCPSCQTRLETDEYEHDPRKFEVQPVIVSSARNKGIVTILPEMTDESHIESAPDMILASNRIVTVIEELTQHQDEFMKLLSTMLSERRITASGRSENGARYNHEYTLDHVVIAHTTEEEWDTFKKNRLKKFPGIERRLDELYLTYALVPSEEVAIYRHAIDRSSLDPHVSPQTLESLARIALDTRYKDVDIEIKTGEETIRTRLTADQKHRYYEGEDQGKLKQSHRRKVLEESFKQKEGREGLPPTYMIEVLSKAMVAERKRVENTEQEASECLTPPKILNFLLEYIPANPTKLGKVPPDKLKKSIEERRRAYDEWLINTVRKAFREDHERDLGLWADYFLTQQNLRDKKVLDEIKDEDLDPLAKVLPNPDMNFYNKLGALAVADGLAQTEDQFHNLIRAEQRNFAHKHAQNGKEFNPLSIPSLRRTVELYLRELDDEKMRDNLKLDAPDEKQISERNNVADRLIEDYGFCPCCAPELFGHAIDIIKKQERDKTKTVGPSIKI